MIPSLYLILTFYDEVGVFMGIKSDGRKRVGSVKGRNNVIILTPHTSPHQPPPGLADKCGNKSKVGPGPQLPMSFIIGGEQGNSSNVW